MSASYPTSVKTWTPVVDDVDEVMAQDINDLYDEVIAVETMLKSVPPRAGHTNVTGTYTLALTDANTRITATSGSAFTISIPLNATVTGFQVGDSVEIIQYGAGAITIAGISGVTLLSKDSKVLTAWQYSGVVITKMATDTWLLVGALA